MGFLANLLVKIGVDTSDLNAGMDKATRSVNKFAGEVESAGKRLSIGISLPLIGVGAAALKAAADMEQTKVAFTTLLKSSDAAKSHLEDLKKFALTTPFQFEDLTKASRLMQAYGFAAADVVPKLRIMGNAVSALGGGNELLERVVRSMGEIGTRGKITGEQLRELSRAGIPALDAVAKKLGVSVAEAQKQISAGTVDAKTAMDALLEYMQNRFAGGMEAQAKTALGSWSNIKDKITFTLVDIGNSLLPVAKNVMTTVLDPMLAKVQDLAAGFAKLPASTQATILGVTGAAAAFPLLTIAIGATITNAIAIGNAFSKSIPLFARLADVVAGLGSRSLGLLATSFSNVGTGYATMLATGLLRVGVWTALAVEVYKVANAYWDMAAARTAAQSAGKEQEDSLLKLEIALKRQGADISEIQKQYNQGKITFTQYLQKLRDIAIEQGKNISQEQKHAVAVVDIDKMLTDAGLKTMAQRKKDLADAKALYAAVVKEYGAGSEIAVEALEKVKAAEGALNPIIDQTKDKLALVPFAAKSVEAAVWVEEMNQAQAGLHKFIQDLAAAGGKEAWLKKYADALKETDAALPSVSLGVVTLDDHLLKLISTGVGSIDSLDAISDALHTFGLDSEKADIPGLQAKFDTLGEAFENDAITVEQYTRAWIALMKAMDAAGEFIDPAARREVVELEKQYGGQIKETRKEENLFQREVTKTFDSVARGISRNVLDMKGFGKTGIAVAKDLAGGFMEIMLKQLFKPLEAQFAKLAGWIGSALGIGGSASSSAASGAASAAGGAASSAGSAGGAAGAASGLAGTVTAVAGVVSAVSGVIGNFQAAATNKSLDVLVNHTLRIFNVTAQMLDFSYIFEDHLMHKLDDMWRTLLDTKDILGKGITTSGGGKGAVTFNNCQFSGTSPDAMMAAAFRQASLAGAI